MAEYIQSLKISKHLVKNKRLILKHYGLKTIENLLVLMFYV